MTTTPVRHPPNVLFNLAGAALVVGGIGVTLYGFAEVVRIMGEFDPLGGDGPPVAVADGVAWVFWGIIIFTIGRYFWRAARRRGARDRFGRLLIIAGYLLIGAGLDAGAHAGVQLWTTGNEDDMQSAVIHALLMFLLWAAPGGLLATIGFRLADEVALATAEASAGL